MRHLKHFILLITGFLLISAAPARADGPVTLMTFQVNGIAVLQPGRTTYGPQLAWIPSIGLGGVGLRGELGVGYFKNAIDDRFLAFNYEAFLTFPIVPLLFTFEAGGGLATWASNGGTHPIASLYTVLSIPGFLNRVFFSYSRFFVPNAGVNELKLGLGFSL